MSIVIHDKYNNLGEVRFLAGELADEYHAGVCGPKLQIAHHLSPTPGGIPTPIEHL